EAPEPAEVAHEGAQRVGDVEVGVDAAAPRLGRVTELVVAVAAIGIAQHFVGFGGFLEARLGAVVAGIAVGMELQGELAIGLLDDLVGGVALDPKHLVVVALGGHQRSSLAARATVTLAGRSRRSPRRYPFSTTDTTVPGTWPGASTSSTASATCGSNGL